MYSVLCTLLYNGSYDTIYTDRFFNAVRKYAGLRAVDVLMGSWGVSVGSCVPTINRSDAPYSSVMRYSIAVHVLKLFGCLLLR